MNPVQAKTYTPADLLALPDANNIELVHGELVEKPMSVLSALVDGNVFARLKNFCDAQSLAIVLPSTNAIQCFPEQPLKVRKPDVSVVRRERFLKEYLRDGFLSIAPDLAVEVVSTHDDFAEVTEKIEEYLTAGVALVWLIDPQNQLVIIHRKDGTVTKLPKQARLSGEDVLPGFSCQVAELFSDIGQFN